MAVGIRFTLSNDEKVEANFGFDLFNELEICHVPPTYTALLEEIESRCSNLKLEANCSNHRRTMLAFGMSGREGKSTGELANLIYDNCCKTGMIEPLLIGEEVVCADFF